jgi:hypothetical protein
MSDRTYDPPPAIGQTHSYLGGQSDKIIHVFRRGEDVLEVRDPETPGWVGLVTIKDGLFHLTGNQSLSAMNLSWHELLDNF